MNCECCHTPMIWIGSLSRGGMDCPKCSAERPIVFDMATGRDCTVVSKVRLPYSMEDLNRLNSDVQNHPDKEPFLGIGAVHHYLDQHLGLAGRCEFWATQEQRMLANEMLTQLMVYGRVVMTVIPDQAGAFDLKVVEIVGDGPGNDQNLVREMVQQQNSPRERLVHSLANGTELK